ncbi:8-oxoguanine deaminase [Arcobacter defluvii]|uniref:8-oxoguanine deaminase n=1 Tax=Arcobacter defluvii TaxID=873191 RepID=A0AAE7BFX9_9BACT|nr:8-oxoguanine deaminase [Arcobacter defluvii]QKF77019.1 8-oxoguanine deaminase [Arcobacter defluvii]RXI29807.1 8-oxoguanine deaminase [Arcobacter defluvii]
MSNIWIKNPLAILAKDADNGIVISDNKIVELVSQNSEPKLKINEIFDASNSVVLPGLINTHHHFYQTLTRAYPDALNKELFPWLKTLYNVWEHLDSEMIYYSTKLALCELLLTGCTTASDHHYVFSKDLENAIDIQFDVVNELGVRAVLTRGSMSLGQKDGGLPPQSVVQNEKDILEDSIRLIKKYHDNTIGAMNQLALAPCSPFSVSTELMKESAKLAKDYDICLHTHLAETIDEENFCLKKFGMRTVDYLEHTDWLNNKTWLAHGIHFNDDEIKRLGKANVGISHCPTSNMMLASGICRSLELENAGVKIGLGVDGSASNDGSNMILEARMAMYLQRLKYGSSKITHQKALSWATKGSASLFNRDDIGEIEVGKQADLALFKLDEIQFSGSHDPLAALLLCGATKANAVMVNGKWKVKDSKLIDVDLDELIFNHTKQAKRLFFKANNK